MLNSKKKLNRKQFLKWIGIGGAGLATGAGISSIGDEKSGLLCKIRPGIVGVNKETSIPGNPGNNSYGSMVHPPFHIDPTFLNRMELKNLEISSGPILKQHISIVEMPLTVAHNTVVKAWTFNGLVPGPVVRAKLGQRMEITLRNDSEHPHSIHFHGSHDPNEDGWEPVVVGSEKMYQLTAGPIGFHPYHCHVPPLASHMAKGLYGGLIVDPPGGRPPAHEFMLILSGWDLEDKGKNDLFCWNGMAGFYDRYPIKVPVGQKVRLYIANMCEYEPVASFHLHAQTFDVFRTGTKLIPDDHTDVVTLGQTERVILEFTLPKRGRYMFHPHQTKMAEKGAMGWIVAV
ncbi:copper oxidase [Leptospira interrogans]|uniref:multicopper oxidase domain-containing protein n=1 Tax=Leptospira interrogans TaxID=173 RepID=UPI0010BFDFAA|nr:multicopper oxidase domain-containing protein [Leptospira interrogans]KAA1288408.1 copper oxidase [Leptospira interrogans serovar Geyaweera]QCO41480.1 copper oxidase [Leptospira interrogans]ULG93805.1 multicopper oxidase domain-containing protein [Leptospira interrogans]UMQ57185.1 multicopper oxidase domain-containing protein [Leptospira interrogans]UNE65932.1 multicopper oxidase domain-containing protein [Leptospira interrogans]